MRKLAIFADVFRECMELSGEGAWTREELEEVLGDEDEYVRRKYFNKYKSKRKPRNTINPENQAVLIDLDF
jgi:hypothetical protein